MTNIRDLFDHTPQRKLPGIDMQAVHACDLCDERGYRGAIPCDHIDHYAENAAGRAAVRAALAEIASRKRPVVRDDTPDVVARQRAAAPAQTLEDQ